MATVVKTKTSTKTGTKTVKDTGKLSGRQKLKQQKIKNKREISKNATKTAIAGEIAGTLTAQETARQQGLTDREKAKQQTYQAAIAKWNGILKSTPDNAEGTNSSMEGSVGGQNNTGSNPGDTFQGW